MTTKPKAKPRKAKGLDKNGHPLCVCGHSSDNHCCGMNECNVQGHCDSFRAAPVGKAKQPKRSPIDDLRKALRDPEYRQAWIANLAMAYIDNDRWYREKMMENIGKVYLSRVDNHRIANNAAEYFLDMLLKAPKPKARSNAK